MAFTDKTLSLRALANPAIIQREYLLELDAALGGAVAIADANNGFMALADFGSSLVAQAVRAVEQKLDGVYPVRATRAAELHNHMADSDYLQAVSGPAALELRLLFDRDYLLAHARSLNDDYKQVVIPAATVFTVGTRRFGLHYPIVIRLNARTGMILATYDTAVKNPLHTLTSNLVDAVQFPSNGINWLILTFPVYQFTRELKDETVVVEQGFKRTYRYSHRFYAVRALTKLGGAWRELRTTLSEDVYDRAEPTLQITLREDAGELDVAIPQIYLSTGLVGQKLRLELYTTEGALDVALTDAEAAACNADFTADPTTPQPYAEILTGLPTIQLVPNQRRITGGSNGLSFEELRRRVVNGSLYDPVPISPVDLANVVADQGFTLVQYLDNITNRIYHANRKMLGAANGNIPVTVANLQLTPAELGAGKAQSILVHDDQLITLLPTTLYKYSAAGNLCIPLSAAEVQHLQGLSKDDLVAELNTHTYTRAPLHLCVYTHDRFPLAKSFNLMTPTVGAIDFIKENAYATAQLSVVSAAITHEAAGTGGFTLRLGVKKTQGLAAVSEDDLAVVLLATDRAGNTAHLRATKVGSTAVLEVYQVHLTTDYHITADRFFRTLMLAADGATITCELPLTTTFDVRLLARASLMPGVSNDPGLLSRVPAAYADFLVLAQQTLTATFGTDLSGGIFNSVDAVYGPQQYVTWPEDVYHTHAHDVYATDADGVPVYTIVDGHVQLTKLHSKGDVVHDANGAPVLQHAAGAIRLDEYGRPIPLATRELQYFITALQFDARLYASEAAGDVAYLDQVAGEIASYVTTVLTIRDRLLEETRLYFRPTRTMGAAEFGLGNGAKTRTDLGLGFSIKFYVPRSVLTNEALLEVIRTTTRAVIESAVTSRVVSLTAIADQLRQLLGAAISSIDVLGINGLPERQTLIVADSDVTPMVALKLVRKTDGTLALERDIAISFAIDE